jgi:hypothetical protein
MKPANPCLCSINLRNQERSNSRQLLARLSQLPNGVRLNDNSSTCLQPASTGRVLIHCAENKSCFEEVLAFDK